MVQYLYLDQYMLSFIISCRYPLPLNLDFCVVVSLTRETRIRPYTAVELIKLKSSGKNNTDLHSRVGPMCSHHCCILILRIPSPIQDVQAPIKCWTWTENHHLVKNAAKLVSASRCSGSQLENHSVSA
jgi:hypothetical protein